MAMQICGRLHHNNLLEYVDNFRIELFRDGIADDGRKKLGQFFTPIEIARQMTALFDILPEQVRILDPGAGAGMLSAAVVSHVLSSERPNVRRMQIVANEIDKNVSLFLKKAFEMCAELCLRRGIEFTFEICEADFIRNATAQIYAPTRFDVAILNPPYRKIKSGSSEWTLLRNAGLPTSNLYTAFLTLASSLLRTDGQLISITPRSFCNGPYFLPFRKALFSKMSIDRLHIYNSRSRAFNADGVLQENIILSAKKSSKGISVTVTSSDDPFDNDVSTQTILSDEVIDRRDRNLVVYLITNSNERRIRKLIHGLDCTLFDLNVDVSTGRVVDFRSKKWLRMPDDPNTVPLLRPVHFYDGYVKWPVHELRKPSGIDFLGCSDKLLVRNECYVLVKRFTSKEQRRRISAAVLDPESLDFEYVGIENHLNYFHRNGVGLPLQLAKGLAAYLNSSIVDQYFRSFSDHTQVNATDLRNLRYPHSKVLGQIGRRIGDRFPKQEVLDTIVTEEMGMQEENATWTSQIRINDALEILKTIDVPRAQQNVRSALTLLALVDIKPSDEWHSATAPLRRISEMMSYFSANYGIEYAPNTRETVRRQTIHQFWQSGLIVHNPDNPDQAINSPHYCYQIAEHFLEFIRRYGSPEWDQGLTLFRIAAGDSLTSLKDTRRSMRMIPVTLPDGSSVSLSSGGQNTLIKSVVEEFCPRFARGGEIVSLGDAGEKLTDSQLLRFQELGIDLDPHEKIPDVVVYLSGRNWLILIEAVTSHGPIDKKRQNELQEVFSKGGAGLVYVTAFQSRQAMTKYLGDISWETDVWLSETPDHLIHFDGERFLGPYSSD